ncbi:MAG: lysine exporter LysO family protein, partial [Bacteroidales bacterium]|nr:lysine exporter LysO family protein [Bacteroidales bacterium]
LIPSFFVENDISKWFLYLLLFFVGIQIGTNKNILNVTKSVGFKIMLVPLATTIGTFAGAIIISLFLSERSITDCLSVGAGFAYYSLSSILITEYRGAELGTIALLANIIREFFVLLLAPWIVKYFGNLAPISAGGATTMDTTLPIISKYSGSDYVIIALFHGVIIDFSVPIWVSLFLSL